MSSVGPSLASIRGQLGPTSAALGGNRGQESNLAKEATVANMGSKLADNSGGRSEIAKG